MPFFSTDLSIRVSHTADKNSFAYSTVRERWPKIVVSARDDVRRTLRLKDCSLEARDEGMAIIAKFEQLLSDMVTDAELKPLVEDDPDIAGYNEELLETGPQSWQNAPWLYLECYLYRLIQTFFSTCSETFWRTYDVFANIKNDSLPASKAGTIELISWFVLTTTAAKSSVTSNSIRKALMEEILDISLWGNATDLSLLTTISMEELHSRQGKEARQASKKNVIVDDTESVWKLFDEMFNKTSLSRPIHIVLDNSGYELLADLVLATYLLSGGYATQVTLHGKAMPWFVSDVTARDLDFLVKSLVNGSMFEGASEASLENLRYFGVMLRDLLASNKMMYDAHLFWTTQHSFWGMAQVAPDLHKQLSDAELVIFKGDLNYRKLVADGMWPKVTSFRDALGSLGKKTNRQGLRILALRGCKADVVVGLRKGQEEDLEKESKVWTRTGKYAVISYCNAKDDS